MKFLNCPYCNNEATTIFTIGANFDVLKNTKTCELCGEKIAFKPISLVAALVILYVFGFCIVEVINVLFAAFPPDNRKIIGYALVPLALPCAAIFSYAFLPFLFHKIGLSFFKKKQPNQKMKADGK